MCKILFPYEYADSVFSINYEKLYKNGYKGLIFDIDNTLVHHGDDSTKEIDELFSRIQKIGFETLVLSNNSEERVLRFLKNIDSLYIYDAEKPKPEGFLCAVEKMKLSINDVIYIGDQIFSDTYGANKVKMANILVKYIKSENETKIGKKRQLEKIVLKIYSKCKKYKHRLGDIILKEE